MPFNLQVVRCEDFIRVGALHRLDVEASRQALAVLAAAMVARGIDRAIVDLRGVQEGLSTPAILELASTFHEAGFRRGHRLALLHRWDRVAESDFFAASVFRRGWNVGSFDTFEEAFDWLMEAAPPAHSAGNSAGNSAGGSGGTTKP